jgi:hypothetical protein
MTPTAASRAFSWRRKEFPISDGSALRVSEKAHSRTSVSSRRSISTHARRRHPRRTQPTAGAILYPFATSKPTKHRTCPNLQPWFGSHTVAPAPAGHFVAMATLAQLNIPDNEEAFLDQVQAYYVRRGCVNGQFDIGAKNKLTSDRVSWERYPKVAQEPISLFHLYRLVVGAGGYDKLSGERLLWRRMLEPFGLQQHLNQGQITFQLKSVYYRNLV